MTHSRQANAVADHVGIRQLDGLQVLSLEGDDQRAWLNGQVTNDVRNTSRGDGVYCLAVDVRGKIMADCWTLDRGERLALVVPRSAVAQLLASFESQIIMEDVEVEPEPGTVVLSVQGPKAGQCVEDAGPLPPSATVYDCDEFGLGGRFVLCSVDERDAVLAALANAARALGGSELDDEAWELARLRAGRARYGADFDSHHYPQEAGLKDRAVSFEKGCYLGQEVVCTLENRGKLRRHLVRLEADGSGPLVPGGELHAESGVQVGSVTSTAHDPDHARTLALGYVKSAQAVAGTALRCGDRELRVVGVVGRA